MKNKTLFWIIIQRALLFVVISASYSLAAVSTSYSVELVGSCLSVVVTTGFGGLVGIWGRIASLVMFSMLLQ